MAVQPPKPSQEVVLVPHTHWDREWYQPFPEFLERLIQMMDHLIDVQDHDERFAHFHLDGQVALIDDYLDARPEREPDIRRLGAAGRLSLGPWYTQMDEFLVAGAGWPVAGGGGTRPRRRPGGSGAPAGRGGRDGRRDGAVRLGLVVPGRPRAGRHPDVARRAPFGVASPSPAERLLRARASEA